MKIVYKVYKVYKVFKAIRAQTLLYELLTL